MYDSCVWKQLIKILLPVTMAFLGLVLLSDLCSGAEDGLDLSVVEDRSHKVRAKWRGDKFWQEATSNLTQLELERARMQSTMTTTPMAYSTQSIPRKRSTLHRENPSNTNNTTTTVQPTTKTQKTSIPKSKSRRTKSTSKPKSSKVSKTQRPNTPRPQQPFSKLTAAPKLQFDRATLVADLSPFQEYYLEYQSDEVEETTTKKPKRIPTISKNDTSSNQTLNATQIKIDFFPKTPVNLLYLLQAYASNMKPIQIQSPIAGGVQTAIPVSVPVRVNPPKSPFLFTLDMDNFFTRMAISFFYSSIAMAPLVYLIIGSLGGLSGLTMVPFTGRKRRRRRRRDVFQSHRLTRLSKHFDDLGIAQKVNNLGSFNTLGS